MPTQQFGPPSSQPSKLDAWRAAKDTLTGYLVFAVFTILGLAMLLCPPTSYDHRATYRVEHKRGGTTTRTEHKTGEQLAQEEPGRITGIRLAGFLFTAIGVAGLRSQLKKSKP